MTEGNAALVVLNSLKVEESLLQIPALDGGSGFVGVLEVNTEVRTPGPGRLRAVDFLGVANHCSSLRKRRRKEKGRKERNSIQFNIQYSIFN